MRVIIRMYDMELRSLWGFRALVLDFRFVFSFLATMEAVAKKTCRNRKRSLFSNR